MVALARLALASSLGLAGTLAMQIAKLDSEASDGGMGGGEGGGRSDQTPEELGFSETGDSDDANSYGKSQFSEEFCLDIGAKGFPIPTFKMLQAANWDAATYFAQLQGAGYAEDALQMTGPDAALLKSDCMKERVHGRTKHIFVGDSQMMSLRNAFHRLNKCPEIWWSNHTEQDISDMMGTVRRNDKSKSKTGGNARFSSKAEQAPGTAQLPHGCKEEGIGSFIHWDGWDNHQLPVKEIKREMRLIGVDPEEGDNVVVWVGSNFVPARHRMTALLQAINKLHEMKVKLVWDSPTYQDVALMAATTTYSEGRDDRTKIPIVFNSISQRKAEGKIGSNMYATEKSLYEQGIEVPTTKRWQITNRYRWANRLQRVRNREIALRAGHRGPHHKAVADHQPLPLGKSAPTSTQPRNRSTSRASR